jgi:chromosome segregation ATPase
MRVLAGVVALGILGCAGGEPGWADRLAGCEAEITAKNGKLSLLETVIDAQHELIERLSRKEKPPEGAALETELEARAERIRQLQRQLDFSNTQLVRVEAQAQGALEIQRKAYESNMDALKERVARLEKELAERK